MVPRTLPTFLRFLTVTLALATASVVPACAAPTEDAADTSSAFTVTSGARFVVSAKPGAIVLARTVDGVAFPFDERSLLGKAVLIHPVAGRAADGVYARARKVEVTDTQYRVTSEPLSLEEMAALTEDEIVRIFVDPKSSQTTSTSTTTLVPQNVVVLDPGFGIQSREVNGFTLDGLNLQTGIDFGKPRLLRPGVSFANTVDRASFKPEVLLDYGSNGLDVGFRGSLDWSSTLTISGQLSGDFFRSPVLRVPPAAMFVPIGPVPVPVTIRAVAFAYCSASVAGPADIAITLEATARLAGSLRFKASLDQPVSQGPWASAATGSSSTGLKPGSSFGASVSCTLPRVEIHADVAGIVGPYVAAALVTSVGTGQGLAVAAQVSAGFGSGLAEGSPSPEIGLFSTTWKP